MMKWIASAAFGMEGMTGRDLKRLGMQNVRVMDIGGAMFEGSFEDAFRANLWLRTCDRILLVMDQFRAVTYEELFQGIKKIEWEKFLPEDARFVNIFNWTYYIPDEVLEEFESATGIRVNYSPFSSNEEMLGAIGYALGQYDLMVSSDYAVAALIENGYLTQIDPARLENYKNINPAFMGQYFDPDNAYSIPYTSVFPLIAYNPDEVSVEIHSFDALWDESFKNSLVLVDEMRTIIGMTAKTLGYSVNETDPAHLAEIREKLLRLKDNVCVFNSDTSHTALIGGDATAGVMYGSMVVAGRDVMDIAVAYPEEGISCGIDNYVIPKDAPHLDAAYILLNYLLDGEVAATAYELIDYASCNSAAAEYLSEEYLNDDSINPPTALAESAEIIRTLDEETQKIYVDMWLAFKN